MECLISVIVPVYNCERYISRCVDSLIDQNCKNYEMIIVDDASTDRSFTIAQEYARKYKFIKCIRHSENLGLPFSRKTGINASSGRYLFFVDGDDWVDHNILKKMSALIEAEDLDIIYVGMDRITDTGKTMWQTKISNTGVSKNIDSEERKRLIVEDGVSFCGKLYRKGWFNNTGIRFIYDASFDEDDVEVLFPIFSSNIGYLEGASYHWCYHHNSMSTIEGVHFNERLYCANFCKDEAKRLSIYEQYKEELDFCFIRSVIMNTIDAIICNFDFSVSDVTYLVNYLEKTDYDCLNNSYVQEMVNSKNYLAIILSDMSRGMKIDKSYYKVFDEIYIKNSARLVKLINYIKQTYKYIALYGAGRRTRSLLHVFPELARIVNTVIDSNIALEGRIVEAGQRVCYLENMERKPELLIIPCSKWIDEIEIEWKCKIVDLEKYIDGEINIEDL